MAQSDPLPRLLGRVLRLFGRRRTIHITIPADQTAVAFTAGQDGLEAGDRIVVHWEERADA